MKPPQCINLLAFEHQNIDGICLEFHDEVRCPSNCSYFKEGIPWNLEELTKEGYYPLCKYFTLKGTFSDSTVICSLDFKTNPKCISDWTN